MRDDYGAEIANFVSRRLVVSGFREGGQQQYVDHPVRVSAVPPISTTLDWARARLGSALTVTDLAIQARVSPATLHRYFRRELGTTPLAWVTGQRVHLALRLAEQDTLGMTAVAQRGGLGTTANLRTIVRRHTGLTPTAYRRQFATSVRSAPSSHRW